MESGGWLWYALAPLPVLAYIGWTWFGNKKTAERLAKAATRRQWRYARTDSSLHGRHKGEPFLAFSRLRSFLPGGSQVRHVFSGTHQGRRFCAFQYSYRRVRTDAELEVAGRSRLLGRRRCVQPWKTWSYVIYTVETPAPAPRLEVAKLGAGRRALHYVEDKMLGESLAGQLRGVAGQLAQVDEEFAKTYGVRSENDSFTLSVLNPDTMRWLVADGRLKRLPIWFHGPELVGWWEGELKVGPIASRVEFLCEILDRVPAAAWGQASPETQSR